MDRQYPSCEVVIVFKTIKDEIAQRIKNGLVLVNFAVLNHMGVSAHDGVSACVNHGFGQFALAVTGQGFVFNAPMWHNNHHVSPICFGLLDVQGHLVWIKPSHTRHSRGCCKPPRKEVKIAQQRDLDALYLERGRLMGLGGVAAATKGRGT